MEHIKKLIVSIRFDSAENTQHLYSNTHPKIHLRHISRLENLHWSQNLYHLIFVK